MNTIIMAAVISFGLGAAGYIIIRFWVMPIGRYQRVKDQIVGSIRQYEILLSQEKSFQLTQEQSEICRKQAIALTDAYYDDLPPWYRMVLTNRKESPDDASKDLQTLSNIREAEHARNRIQKIKIHLHLA
jgi:hypothetical protein